MRARSCQRCHAARVDELKACQIDDYLALGSCDCRELGRDTRGVGYVKLAAQSHDNITVACVAN
jgi:hypothetical protein